MLVDSLISMLTKQAIVMKLMKKMKTMMVFALTCVDWPCFEASFQAPASVADRRDSNAIRCVLEYHPLCAVLVRERMHRLPPSSAPLLTPTGNQEVSFLRLF
jgi:hypothetical protein